jgi:serine/threonine-protein kinase HipA
MTANLVFWLLASIDGHAKNFSIFLLPGGGFKLTPLYFTDGQNEDAEYF